jgi:hypothetical protein
MENTLEAARSIMATTVAHWEVADHDVEVRSPRT